MGPDVQILIAVLAHNEEAHIGACLESLPKGVPVHVVVNGSRDRTAAVARGVQGVTVHEFEQGGKARSWNRFVFDTLDAFAAVNIFVDGDAIIAPGSIPALVAALQANRSANAAAALPLNGRQARVYRETTLRDRGLFGDLYAVRGAFLARMKAAAIRLPDDLIGDDGLIAALVKTDLGAEAAWDAARVVPVAEAGFFMAQPANPIDPRTWPMQYRRMINYSLRYFQNRIVSAIMQDQGPKALPRDLAALYPTWLPLFMPRRSPRWWWFDRLALARMFAASARYR
jgi:glycosyltransferase involved in cell wall biosynthesis